MSYEICKYCGLHLDLHEEGQDFCDGCLKAAAEGGFDLNYPEEKEPLLKPFLVKVVMTTKIFPEALNDESCPELMRLKGVLQNPVYHPEGDAYIHTMFVVEAAQAIAERDKLSVEDTSILCLAAICHDFGKATNTVLVDGIWKSPGHDAAGVEPTRAFLTRLGVTSDFQERIVCLVEEHMVHTYLPKDKLPSRKTAIKLLQRLRGKTTLEELQRLVEADKSGRPPLAKEVPTTFLLLREVCESITEEELNPVPKPKPFLTGQDLLAIGFTQGRQLGLALAAVNAYAEKANSGPLVGDGEDGILFPESLALHQLSEIRENDPSCEDFTKYFPPL